MNRKTDQYLDELGKEVFENAPLESPKLDFTASVMTQISELKSSTSIVYKPLITKKGWFVIFGFVTALVLTFAYSSNSMEPTSIFDRVNFRVLSDIKMFDTVMNLSVSKTIVYAVILFGIMFSVQITFLKSHFNKRLGGV